MKIKYEQINGGFAVYFSIELKDSFKSTFSTAKWDSVCRCWTVGPRSLKKLQAWIELAQQVEDKLEEEKAQERAAKELTDTEIDIDAMRRSLENIAADSNKLDETLALLAAAKEKLAAAQSEVEAAKAVEKAKENEIKEALNSIIDVKAVFEAVDTMRRTHGKARAKYVFEDAQNVIKAELDKLRAAGFESPAMRYWWYANFNRPDRDNVDNAPSFYQLERYEAE